MSCEGITKKKSKTGGYDYYFIKYDVLRGFEEVFWYHETEEEAKKKKGRKIPNTFDIE